MKISRSDRRDMDQSDARITKAVNRIKKTAERARRDARMIGKVKAGKLPYTPIVMSWLSKQLGKKSTLITEKEVKAVVAS